MKYYIHLLLFLVTAHFSLSAQWVQTNGPSGSLIFDMEQIGDKAWVGTPTGLYTSTPGSGWQISDLIPRTFWVVDFYKTATDMLILCIQQDGSTIKVLHSTDQGNSWATHDFSYPYSIFYNPVVFPSYIVKTGDRIYVHTAQEAYYVDNFTGPWSSIKLPNNFTIVSMAIDAHSIVARTNSGGLKLCKSNDGGVTWIVNSIFDGVDFYLEDSLIITQNANLNIVISTDWGKTWIEKPYRPIVIEEIRRSDDGKLYTGRGDSVFYSADNGLTWIGKHIGSPYYSSNNLMATLINNDFTLVGTRQGIRKANSWNSSFSANNQGLTNDPIILTSNDKDRLYALTAFECFYTKNKGNTWSKMAIPYNPDPPYLNLLSKGDTIFLDAQYFTNGKPKIARSFNNGANWSLIELPVNTLLEPFVHYISADPFVWSENAILVKFRSIPSASYAISTDMGNTWKSFIYVNNDLSGYVRDMIYINNKIYAFEPGGVVRVSSDQGDTWTIVFDLPAMNSGITEIDRVFKVGNRYYITGNNNNLLYSDDQFSSINIIKANGLPVLEGALYDPLGIITPIGDTLFGITRNEREILISLDQGQNWSLFNNGLDVSWAIPQEICTHDNELFIGVHFGSVWRYDGIISSTDEQTDAQPTTPSLPIFPNPAVDHVTIQLPTEFSEGQSAQLNLYDLEGQLLFYQTVKTTAQLNLTLPDLESGVYILEVATEKGRSTGRLVKQ